MSNTTDRELLEFAAKAAGIEINWFKWERLTCQWNPITDDGDALRLAVKLKMHVSVFSDAIGIGTPGGGYTETKLVDEANATTRRAITCAAAEIGKQMP